MQVDLLRGAWAEDHVTGLAVQSHSQRLALEPAQARVHGLQQAGNSDDGRDRQTAGQDYGMGRARTGGECDASQQPERDLRSHRRRKVFRNSDRRDDGQFQHIAGQDARDPRADVAHVRRPSRDELVVEGGQDRRRSLGCGLDCRDRSLARSDAPNGLVDQGGVSGDERLRLEDLGLIRPAELSDTGRQRPQLSGRLFASRPESWHGIECCGS